MISRAAEFMVSRGKYDFKRTLVPSSGPDDRRQLLAAPEKHWKRGYSAMVAALAKIAEVLGGHAELLLVIPEHKVALTGGQRESQCDIFALVRIEDKTCALPVEAKVSEFFGPMVAEWMTNASPGKVERLRFICELLGLQSPPPTLRYQLFHRTAAAVIEAHRFKTDRAAMVVQSFSQDHR